MVSQAGGNGWFMTANRRQTRRRTSQNATGTNSKAGSKMGFTQAATPAATRARPAALRAVKRLRRFVSGVTSMQDSLRRCPRIGLPESHRVAKHLRRADKERLNGQFLLVGVYLEAISAGRRNTQDPFMKHNLV